MSNKITKISSEEKGLNTLRDITEDSIIFIIRPDKEIFNVIVEIHLMLKALKGGNCTETLIFIPKENYDIIEYMSTNSMLAEFTIENFNIDLIPIDTDLFSMEKENNIQEIYLDKNYSCISELANAVVKLETCFGKIKHKYIKGDLAQTFCDLVEEKEKENDLKITEDEILGMVVLDRSVDFITLMTTNYTTEGIIDEVIGINLGRIEIKKSVLLDNSKNSKAKSDKLNVKVRYGLTTDINSFYCSFRCMHYKDATQYMKSVERYFENISSKLKQKLSFEELNKYTKELKNYTTNLKSSLDQNENLVSFILDELLKDKDLSKSREKEVILLSGETPNDLRSFYDEYLCEQKDLIKLIKLMIIESLTQNGIQGYQQLKREIINIYGFQKIFLFRDLENLGWLKERPLLKTLKKLIGSSYSDLFNKLELVSENPEPNKFDDCSYVMEGCSPISLKIIEKAVKGQWSTIIDTLRKMPGATNMPQDENAIIRPKKDKNIMFIIFIGGVTYAEIEGIRFLNRKFKEEYLKGKRKKTQFIILTTSILNSRKILESLGKNFRSIYNMKMFNDESNK